MTTLTKAFNQWATRPADERFSSLDALHAAVKHHRDVATEAESVPFDSLRVAVEQRNGDDPPHPILIGRAGVPAQFTHWSFGQFARKAGAPAEYLRQLPAALAADNLNHGIAQTNRIYERENDNEEKTVKLLFAKNGDVTLRAMTSDKYTRIWNVDITARLQRLVQQRPEWQPAPAAFDGSRGLYASDRDVFAFLVDNDRRIFETEKGGGLGRGFFVENSEVGDASFKITTFWYEYICGNHRVWGAKASQRFASRTSRTPMIAPSRARSSCAATRTRARTTTRRKCSPRASSCSAARRTRCSTRVRAARRGALAQADRRVVRQGAGARRVVRRSEERVGPGRGHHRDRARPAECERARRARSRGGESYGHGVLVRARRVQL